LPSEIAKVSLDHLRRASDKGSVVETENINNLEVAILQPSLEKSFVERNCPFHPGDASHPEKLSILKRFYIIDELNFGIHDPNIGLRQVINGTVSSGHQSGEDR
jgi:hypothetical protein